MGLQNAFKNSFFKASELVSTKTILLKHYYRRQGHSPKTTFQLQDNILGGINFPKITYHVFVCDSENYMEKLFGNYFLGKSHFSYMK